jgi:hypothetical protein
MANRGEADHPGRHRSLSGRSNGEWPPPLPGRRDLAGQGRKDRRGLICEVGRPAWFTTGHPVNAAKPDGEQHVTELEGLRTLFVRGIMNTLFLSGVLGIVMAFIAYGRMVLRPIF